MDTTKRVFLYKKQVLAFWRFLETSYIDQNGLLGKQLEKADGGLMMAAILRILTKKDQIN